MAFALQGTPSVAFRLAAHTSATLKSGLRLSPPAASFRPVSFDGISGPTGAHQSAAISGFLKLPTGNSAEHHRLNTDFPNRAT